MVKMLGGQLAENRLFTLLFTQIVILTNVSTYEGLRAKLASSVGPTMRLATWSASSRC